MNRTKFLVSCAAIAGAGATGFLLSDRHSFIRSDMNESHDSKFDFQPGEKEILYLASLAPSGHNTQPWRIKYIEPYHWIIANDKTRWLPAVDPDQRETLLSIGAFAQNLEYGANSFGYDCDFKWLAASNQDEDLVEVTLRNQMMHASFNTENIKLRRTVRSGYLRNTIHKEHVKFLTTAEKEHFHFFPNSSKEYRWLSEQTIEANRQQTYRDVAQAELSNWIRFSGKDAKRHADGLTTASMEIEGLSGWVVRNFYQKENVMTKQFREQTLDKVRTQIEHSGGWMLITHPKNSPLALFETGQRLQRMLLKTREKMIGIHPMTQLLEEAPFRDSINHAVGVPATIQFVLRMGYLTDYPAPVSLRRPVEQFVQTAGR